MLEWPKWKTDLDVFQNIKSGFILEGNIHDQQVWINEEDQSCSVRASLNHFLFDYLKRKIHYDVVVFYNRIDGFFNEDSAEDLDLFYKICPASKSGGCDEGTGAEVSDMEKAAATMRTAVKNIDVSVAIVFDLANIALASADVLSEAETGLFARLLLASREATMAPSKESGNFLMNSLYFVVEKANDLPAWFYLNNPYVKTITITKMDKSLRSSLIKGQCELEAFSDYASLSPEEKEKAIEKLAELTEGFSTADLYGFINMCHEKNFQLKDGKKAVDFFRYGVTESQWDKIDPSKIRNIRELLTRRVKGQDEAIRQASEVICRASLGLTGIQKSSGSRPKGILFLAGPTGTGKTELAKAIAELLFGDENFITRFDMSEYQQPQADQKLLGAPPGYVGYGAGGQLTNAVKEKPFNLLLFDEIDKAHPSILDKFLQILDDGRMTDSFGETVYFSESLIIFTSNLGVTREMPDGRRVSNIDIDMDYSQVRKTITAAIKEFFINIGRPEILNRIGSNIIVFNYIKDPQVIRQIVDLQLGKVKNNLAVEKHVQLHFSDAYVEKILQRVSTNLENGARGIGNIVEEYLVNLLPYVFIEKGIHGDCEIDVLDLSEDKKLVVEIRAAQPVAEETPVAQPSEAAVPQAPQPPAEPDTSGAGFPSLHLPPVTF